MSLTAWMVGFPESRGDKEGCTFRVSAIFETYIEAKRYRAGGFGFILPMHDMDGNMHPLISHVTIKHSKKGSAEC